MTRDRSGEPPPRREPRLPQKWAPHREKFEGERVEQARTALRAEDLFPEADQCPDCAEARAATSDPTFLCEAHMAALMGLGKR